LNRLEAIAAERVFDEPWQAQAFALAVRLSQTGAFTWAEWTEALSAQIAARGSDDGERYYEAWLAALENLVSLKGLAQPTELERRRAEWDHAYRTTPHGAPVAL